MKHRTFWLSTKLILVALMLAVSAIAAEPFHVQPAAAQTGCPFGYSYFAGYGCVPGGGNGLCPYGYMFSNGGCVASGTVGGCPLGYANFGAGCVATNNGFGTGCNYVAGVCYPATGLGGCTYINGTCIATNTGCSYLNGYCVGTNTGCSYLNGYCVATNTGCTYLNGVCVATNTGCTYLNGTCVGTNAGCSYLNGYCVATNTGCTYVNSTCVATNTGCSYLNGVCVATNTGTGTGCNYVNGVCYSTNTTCTAGAINAFGVCVQNTGCSYGYGGTCSTAGVGSTQLYAGCNEVITPGSLLTGNNVTVLVSLVQPSGIVVSVWEFNNGLHIMQAVYFSAAGAPTDTSQLGLSRSTFICVNSGGTFTSNG